MNKPAQKELNSIFYLTLRDMQMPGFVSVVDVSELAGDDVELHFAVDVHPKNGQTLVGRIVKGRKDENGKPAKKALTAEETSKAWGVYVEKMNEANDAADKKKESTKKPSKSAAGSEGTKKK